MAKRKFASISLTVRDRAISSKFSTHRVSEHCILGNFQKIFPSPKNGGHFEFFEFLPKIAKRKFASISLTVRDRAISSKFSTHRVSKECNLCNFQKIFPSPKNGGHFEFFEFLPKMAKRKFASISLTVRDRAISSKFSTHRVSEHCILGNFQKIFPSPKNGGHFEFFEFLPKIAKRKFASISLTVRDRAISSKFSTHRVSKECNLCNFQKIFPSPKNGGHFEFFEFLPKMAKRKFASISLTVRDRAISSKFSIHRVSKECNLCNFQKHFPSPKMAAIWNFQKIFPSPKMAAILIFRILAKNRKTGICFYLLNRAR